MDKITAYSRARKTAREWLANHDGPPGVARAMAARLARAYVQYGDLLRAADVDLIGTEAVRHYVEGELDRHAGAR